MPQNLRIAASTFATALAIFGSIIFTDVLSHGGETGHDFAPPEGSNATFGFQHIYVLRHPSHASRSINMESLRMSLNLTWEYFPAVDGVSGSASSNPYAAKFLNDKDVDAGHLAIWHDIAHRHRYSTALILTDDIDIDVAAHHILGEVHYAINPSAFHWDMLYLGHCGEHKSIRLHFPSPAALVEFPLAAHGLLRAGTDALRGYERIYLAHEPRCLHAYAVTPHAAEVLLKRTRSNASEENDGQLGENNLAHALDERVAKLVGQWAMDTFALHPVLVSPIQATRINLRRLDGGDAGLLPLSHGVLGQGDNPRYHPHDPYGNVYRIDRVELRAYHNTVVCADGALGQIVKLRDSCEDESRVKMVPVTGRRAWIKIHADNLRGFLYGLADGETLGVSLVVNGKDGSVAASYAKLTLAENCGWPFVMNKDSTSVLCVDEAKAPGRAVFRKRCAPELSFMMRQDSYGRRHIRTASGVYLVIVTRLIIGKATLVLALALAPPSLARSNTATVTYAATTAPVVAFKTSTSLYLRAPSIRDGPITLSASAGAMETFEIVAHTNEYRDWVSLKTHHARYWMAPDGHGQKLETSGHVKEWELFKIELVKE